MFLPSISEVRARYSDQCADGEIDSVLCFILQKDKAFLFAHNDYRLSPITYVKFRYFVWQRRRGIPIAYITHHKEFFGIDLYVNKHTLIPRPETEMMVEAALEEIKKARNQKINLIDVGTGSGCIPIAIASELKKQCNNVTMKPGPADKIKIYATDISKGALRIAARNARTQNVSIDFLQGNLLEPLLKEKGIWNKEQVIITANLPYLTEEQFTSEPSIRYEPKSALVAANQGLALYEQLLAQIASQLFLIPCSLLLLLEIDPSQSTLITPLVQRYLPAAHVTIKPDLAGHSRLVHIWLDKGQKIA